MKKLLKKQKQLLLFVLAGGLSSIFEIGSFKLFSQTLPQMLDWEQSLYGIHYPLSNVGSTLMGILSNYLFSIWFVFSRSKHTKRREFFYFMVVSIVSTFLSLLFFQFFYSNLFSHTAINLKFFVFSPEMLSKILSILLVSILNYTVKKKIVFKQ